MKKPARGTHATTQKFTEIEDIIDDVVILSSFNACLIIEVTATNFALLSKDEQDAKILSYASLLNSLSFPIQIFIRSKKIDISSYLKLLAEEAQKTQNKMLGRHIKLYRDFVEALVKVNTVLDKKFYIIISYSVFEKGVTERSLKRGSLQKITFFKEAKNALSVKAQSLYSQLRRLSLTAKTLKKEELVKLFYEIYNEGSLEISRMQNNIEIPIAKIRNAI